MKAQQSTTSLTTSGQPELTAEAEVRLESATCPKHGEYQRRILAFPPWPGSEVRSPCPKCSAEQSAAREAREKREAAEQRRHRVLHLTGAAGVPLRFQSRGFENYTAESKGQKYALAVCEKFAGNWRDQYVRGTSLLLTGGPGTGKTHLACAIANAVISEHLASVRFITVSEMLRRIKETYNRDSEASESKVIVGFAECDLLIVDEIGVQVGSEHEKLLLFEILNDRYQNLMPTVLLSNLSANELETYLGHRVMDRFRECGVVVPFNWESHRGVRKLRPVPSSKAEAGTTG